MNANNGLIKISRIILIINKMSDKNKKTKSERLYAKSDKLFEKDRGKLKAKATKKQKEGKNMKRVMNKRSRVQDRERKVFIKASEAETKENGASKKFPEIKKKNEGKFTAWVEKNMGGMDTCKAASKVMRSRTKKYSPAVVKMANYANNFGCKTKKEDGASVPLKGKQKNLPDALKSKILTSPGKK